MAAVRRATSPALAPGTANQGPSLGRSEALVFALRFCELLRQAWTGQALLQMECSKLRLQRGLSLAESVVSGPVASSNPSLHFTDHRLVEIKSRLGSLLAARAAGECISFRVPDPELASGRLAGQLWNHEGRSLRHRSYRNWIDLAESLHCRMVTPRPAASPFVDMRFQKLRTDEISPEQTLSLTERYGEQSEFYAIQKLEEPCFLQDLSSAYARVRAQHRRRVLDLGVHRGDELLPLQAMWAQHSPKDAHCIGVDHCESAIQHARSRFQDPKFRFECKDIGDYEKWDYAPFDLIISIGTLQCRNLQGKSTFPGLLRRFLAKDGAVILGFPYLRYIDGEIRQGGQMKNYSEAEHSLVYKDLMFYRKLLQRRATQTTITGRYYLFLSAWSNSRRDV